MIEDYGIDLVRMMENAGRALAIVARERFLGTRAAGRRVTVLAGTGGNGGGALVAARRLRGWGAQVHVYVTKPAERFTHVPAQQLEILRRINVPILAADRIGEAEPSDVVLDGVIGYSLQGAPRGAAASLIRWTNEQTAPVLALDTPSGLDTTTGAVYDPAVEAAATLTLALPKDGLRDPRAVDSVGELYLADIGVPPSLYAKEPLELTVGPIFTASDVVRLR